MTLLERLKGIKKLLGPNGEHWTKNAFAKDKDGNRTESTAKSAVQWCLLGAERKVAGAINSDPFEAVMAEATDREPCWFSIPSFNDNNRWSTVQKALDKAIEIACKREQAKKHKGAKA